MLWCPHIGIPHASIICMSFPRWIELKALLKVRTAGKLFDLMPSTSPH